MGARAIAAVAAIVLVAIVAASLSASALKYPKWIVISLYNPEGEPIKLFGYITVVNDRFSFWNESSKKFRGGIVASWECLLKPDCLLANSRICLDFNPYTEEPWLGKTRDWYCFPLKPFVVNVSSAWINDTLYVNITMWDVGLVRFCVYTELGALVPGARVVLTDPQGRPYVLRSELGVTYTLEARTGKDGCTGPRQVPVGITAKAEWHGVSALHYVNVTDVRGGRAVITLPLRLGETFELRVVARDGVAVTVAVAGQPCINGTCTLSLTSIGERVVFAGRVLGTVSLEAALNGTLVLDVGSNATRLCVYRDDGSPLAFNATVGGVAVSGRGCLSLAVPNMPHTVTVSVEGRTLKARGPGSHELYVDLTPPVVERVWVNASWTTILGTRCIGVWLYVEARDPNEHGSGVEAVRALMGATRGSQLEYLGGNTWRLFLDCYMQPGGLYKIVVNVTDKAGNTASKTFTYRVRPGVTWLLGGPKAAATTPTRTATAATPASPAQTAPTPAPTAATGTPTGALGGYAVALFAILAVVAAVAAVAILAAKRLRR